MLRYLLRTIDALDLHVKYRRKLCRYTVDIRAHHRSYQPWQTRFQSGNFRIQVLTTLWNATDSVGQ